MSEEAPQVRFFGTPEQPPSPADQAPAPAPARPSQDGPILRTAEEVLAATEAKPPTGDRMEFPAWPDGLTPPRQGTSVLAVRCLANATSAPAKGDRVLILWPLSVGDERVADARAMLQNNPDGATITERAKQMIRAVDGQPVDWKRATAMDELWDEIGSKYRGMVKHLYVRMHTLDEEERIGFFVHSLAHRVVG